MEKEINIDEEIKITPLQKELFGELAHDIVVASNFEKWRKQKIKKEIEIYNKRYKK